MGVSFGLSHMAPLWRNPRGFYDAPAPTEGVSPWAGSALPGPLGTAAGDASSRLAEDREAGPAEVRRAANDSASFTLGSTTFRLLRLDREWRQDEDEVRVPPQQAVAIIEQAARRYQRDQDAAHLFDTAVAQLADLHDNGVFVLLRREPQYERGTGSAARSAPASTPAVLRSAAPPEPPTSSLDEPFMGAAQAAVLKDAAASGVPFCEECARAAAARGGTTTAA